MVLMVVKSLSLEPKSRKEDKIEEKQKAPRSLSTQAAFLESISKQQEVQRRQFEHEIKMQMVTQESEEKRQESRRKFELDKRQKEEEQEYEWIENGWSINRL